MPGNRKSRSKKIASPTSLILTGAGLIIIAITVFITASWKPSPAVGVGPVPGVVNYLAPDLELVDLSGVPVSLENLSGQVVLVNNWATWCPPTFPIWLDPTGLALRVFQNNALPSSYVIDKSGVVRLIWMGAVSLEALENYVTPLFTD
jgi:thiol-disulfide isomerase/thioredoxin